MCNLSLEIHLIGFQKLSLWFVICFCLDCLCVVKEDKDDPMEDEASILRKMRRLTDYYDVHKEIGRWVIRPEPHLDTHHLSLMISSVGLETQRADSISSCWWQISGLLTHHTRLRFNKASAEKSVGTLLKIHFWSGSMQFHAPQSKDDSATSEEAIRPLKFEGSKNMGSLHFLIRFVQVLYWVITQNPLI